MVLSLVVPVVVLMSLSVRHHLRQESGTEITLPIAGYDPRDFLSGHYVTYKVDYGAAIPCQRSKKNEVWYVCLGTKTATEKKPERCPQMIKGTCKAGTFTAGIERFYIPETKATFLDEKTRGGKASLVVTVDEEGNARVKDLLIEGRSWRESR